MARNRPNVLVFLTDQQRWDTTGVHGNPLGLTPAFDRIAEGGVHVANSFTCQPVCAPARSALQTGRYPTSTGCFRNGIPLPAGTRTLAHHFGDAGYQTAYLGKWHLADGDVAGPVRAHQRGGYQRWLAANLLEFTSDAYHTTLYDEHGTAREFGGYRADAVGEAALRFLTERREDPFFLFLSLLEPHHQNSRDDYPAPRGYPERFGADWVPGDLAALDGNWPQHLAGYYGMVAKVDEVFDRVLKALADSGYGDDTIVLFTSDHGCHFKTRNDEYKRSCHDASIRVPTVLHGPGLTGVGALPHLVSHVDLAPTVLDAAGIAVPDEMQGRSIMPLIRGEEVNWPDDVLVQISESQVGRALRTDGWKYSALAPGGDGWETASAKHYVDDCLYDLDADPHELHNLVGDPSYADVLGRLRWRLTERIAESGEPRPMITAGSPAAPEGHPR
jgi:arylsulfatase A-like enzyme